MKLISWNVNGLRACLTKGFLDFFHQENPDIFCVQETKMQEGQAEVPLDGYYQYWNSADKKGYSGTAVFTRVKPISVQNDFGIDVHSHEGRTITLEFDTFYLVNCYTPNAQHELARLSYRLEWERDFRDYLNSLSKKKPVILCGDLNVAHQEIDLKNPKTNRGNPGFSDEERAEMTQLLACGFVDSFRFLYPDTTEAYTWWSYRFRAREKNIGWRIDYFIASDAIKNEIHDSVIYSDVLGSDHCPVGLSVF